MNQRTLDSEERKICAFGKLRKGLTEEQKSDILSSTNDFYENFQ